MEFKNFTEPHDSYRAIAPLRLLKVKSSQKLPGKKWFLELSVVLTFSNIWPGQREDPRDMGEVVLPDGPQRREERGPRAVGDVQVNWFPCLIPKKFRMFADAHFVQGVRERAAEVRGSESLRRRYWPGSRTPLGQRLRLLQWRRPGDQEEQTHKKKQR